MAVAILHDVIEDSDYTVEDLLNLDVPSEVANAVESLTKVKGENYEAFIERVLENKLATKIKIADIEDNINILRLNTVQNKDLERIAKYHKAWQTLKRGR